MALKTYKPTTPGQRQLVLVDRSALYKGAPVKSLTEGKPSTGGRNNNGRITTRFRGGGHKKSFRVVDFKRKKFDAPAKVERLGLKTYTQAVETADGKRIRVRVGPFNSRDEADKVAAKVRGGGLSSAVLTL